MYTSVLQPLYITRRYTQTLPSTDEKGAMTGPSSVAMSVSLKPTRTTSEVFRREILEAEEVCSNCFRKVVEVVEAKKIIRQLSEYSIFGEDDRCYLRVYTLDDNTEDVRLPYEDRVDGNFCDECGTEIGAEGWEHTRSKTEALRHARNAAETLRQRGYAVDEEKLLTEVRKRKSEEGQRREFEIFRDAVEVAVKEPLKQ